MKHISNTSTGKYLTFILAEESYGIGILKTKEIIGMMPITSVPRMPKFVRRVINLCSKVIPAFFRAIKIDKTTINVYLK